MDEDRWSRFVRKYGGERILVNSAADWGVSDALKVARTAAHMREGGIAEATIAQIVWSNPVAFFAQSGRFETADLAQPPPIDQRELWQGNSVLRGGQPPIVRE